VIHINVIQSDITTLAVDAVVNAANEALLGEPALLANCYRACLQMAVEHRIKSIAFPAISCGVYGYPPALAVPIAVGAVLAWQAEHEQPQQVTFACFDAAMAALYRQVLAT